MWVQIVLNALVFGVVANAPVWLAARLLGFSLSGAFNLEYLALGVLALFLRRLLVGVLLFLLVVLDVTYNVGHTYMLNTSEMLDSVGSLPLYLQAHRAALAALLLATATASVLAAWRGRPGKRLFVPTPTSRWPLAAALVAIACALVGADLARQNVVTLATDYQSGRLRLTRNTAHRLLMEAVELRRTSNRRQSFTAEPEQSASAGLVLSAFAEAGRQPNIVFVVVESWGRPLSSRLAERLVSSYGGGVQALYSLQQGEIPFHGATIAGELRELCGTSLGLGVLRASAEQLSGCLPAQAAHAGYHTVSVHGFKRGMFSRGSWYPRAGFAESWFHTELNLAGLPDCPGPFPGICDASVAEWIGARLDAARSPQLLYWVTLNSHLPVPLANRVVDPPSCSGDPELADAAVCSWYQLITNVHRSVAALALRERARPTVFVVVGDHAPPFTDAARRADFSYEVVPYLILTPRPAAAPPAPPREVAAEKPARPQERRQRMLVRAAHPVLPAGSGAHGQ